ncbi:MAG: HD domain-containing protein [Actinomycetota bacterium]|nr:HD domain-containing protein [Actinomycetota bacterium]
MRFLAGLVGEILDHAESEARERRAELELSGIRALLAALEARDHYTGEHSRTVVRLATAVAERLGLSRREVLEVEQVAMLHDIGKVGIPDSVLQKRAALSREEWELMLQHPAWGSGSSEHRQSLPPRPGCPRRARALRRHRIPRRPRARADSDRQPHHVRLRCLPRDDERSPVPGRHVR